MKLLSQALLSFLPLTVVTGVVYPVFMNQVAAWCFPYQAVGSIVKRPDGTALGSELLAQDFKSPRVFWSRPSAVNYATIPSGASNLGPTSSTLKLAIAERTNLLRTAHRLPVDSPVPTELVQASGSGLDPHISPEAAQFQLERVSTERAWTSAQKEQVRQMITEMTEPPQFGLLGRPRVNILLLNQRLETLP